MRRKLISMLLLTVSAGTGPAWGQIALPAGSDGSVSVVELTELAIYHKQRQELIVRAVLDLPAGPVDVDRLALIIPVPSVPEFIGFEDSSVLRDVKGYYRRGQGDLQEPRRITGDYELTRRAIAADDTNPASQMLNRWLAANGFAPVEAADLKYYDENGWCFVVERVSGGKPLGIGALRPVRISFGGGRITFPVRIMAGPRPFSCTLFLMTKNNLDVTPLEDYGFGIGDGASRKKLKHLPESLAALIGRSGGEYSVFKEFKRGHVYLFSATTDVHRPDWPGEVQLPGPHVSIFGIMQNVLAVAAAALAVIIMSRRRKKTGNE